MDKEIHAYFRRVQSKDRLLFNNMAFRLLSYRLQVWWNNLIASFLEALLYIRDVQIIIVLGQESDDEDTPPYSAGGDDDFY